MRTQQSTGNTQIRTQKLQHEGENTAINWQHIREFLLGNNPEPVGEDLPILSGMFT